MQFVRFSPSLCLGRTRDPLLLLWLLVVVVSDCVKALCESERVVCLLFVCSFLQDVAGRESELRFALELETAEPDRLRRKYRRLLVTPGFFCTAWFPVRSHHGWRDRKALVVFFSDQVMCLWQSLALICCDSPFTRNDSCSRIGRAFAFKSKIIPL